MRHIGWAALAAILPTTPALAQTYATERGTNAPSGFAVPSGGHMVYTPDSVRRTQQRQADRQARGDRRDRDRGGIAVGIGVPVTVSAGYLGPQQDLSPYGGGYEEGFVPQVPVFYGGSGSPADPPISPCRSYSGPATAARAAAQAPSAFRDGC